MDYRLFNYFTTVSVNGGVSFPRSSNTLAIYKMDFRRHIQAFPSFRKARIRDISPQLLQSYYNAKTKEGLSAHTIIKHHSHINMFLKYLYRMDVIKDNPAARVTLPKKKKPCNHCGYRVFFGARGGT